MDSVKFILNKDYRYYSSKMASNIQMEILGRFLTDDVRSNPSSFKEYALNDWEIYTPSNTTSLEKQNSYILLNDQYSEEEVPTQLKMTHNQFIKLLDEWEEKVCKFEPKEVIINYINDEFIIETKN